MRKKTGFLIISMLEATKEKIINNSIALIAVQILLWSLSSDICAQIERNNLSVTDNVRRLDSLVSIASGKIAFDYSVPTFTEFKIALNSAKLNPDSQNLAKLSLALRNLRSKESPFCIVMNITDNPASRMAFTWFTNYGIPDGKVQVVSGVVTDPSQFSKQSILAEVQSDTSNQLSVNYCVSSNNFKDIEGLHDNVKMNFTVNKAIVKDLQPGKSYSFRVGSPQNWSDIGTFKTMSEKENDFSFVYTTDPQANTEEMFDISQRSTHAAFKMFPQTSFWICCGDHVQTSGTNNSEWEWEKFFVTQQDLLLRYPYAPVIGNHDKSTNHNFTYHFNTSSAGFDKKMSDSPGSVYSFTWGNALFIALSFEDYNKPGYLETLAKWMKEQVALNPDKKWRIAFYHKTIYTGSEHHHEDNDSKIVRQRIAPLFDSLNIDVALQGHDHIYEVIGPVRNFSLIPGSIKDQTYVRPDDRENVTGHLFGIYNVKNGTLYFLNNSVGKKKYNPLTKLGMDSLEIKTGIKDYYSLFTGRFGQTGYPTFSNCRVTPDTIFISTWQVFDDGSSSLLDKIKITK